MAVSLLLVKPQHTEQHGKTRMNRSMTTTFFSTHRRAWYLTLSFLGLSCVLSPVAYSHGGDDHAEKTVAVATGWLPRAQATTESFELVLVADGDHGWLYLSDFKTNQPISDAQLTLDIQPVQQQNTTPAQAGLTAQSTGNAGSYRVDWQPLTDGDYAVTATLVSQANADVLTLQLPMRSAGEFVHVHSWAEFKTPMLWGVAGLIILVGAWFGWRRHQQGGVHA